VVVVAACYAPSPQAGSACASNGACPAPLVCAPATDTCERTAGGPADAPPGGSDAAARDTAIDAPPAPDCWPLWEAMGSATPLTTPVALTVLNTSTDDRHPWMSPDGLTLFWATGGAASANEQIVHASRPTRAADAWTAPVVSTDPDTANVADQGAALTADGLVVSFASSRAGGSGNTDLWQATRASTTEPFGSADHAPYAAIDTSGIEADPDLSADGLIIVYSNQTGTQSIEFATRATRADAFDAPQVITIAGAPASLNNPRVSPDQLVLFYSGTLAGSTGVLVATRTLDTAAFTTLGGIAIDGSANDTGIGLSGDGCDLVFASTRASGDFDLFETTVVQ
jgi:Tol biopolymer transport system component